MADERLRYLSSELGLRAVAVVTTESVAEGRRVHQTAPTSTAALGRIISGAALLGSTLKGQQTVTLRINGGGPAGTLIGTCNAEGHLRGYIANPGADLEPTPGRKLDVAALVGTDGYLSVSYDLGLKEPYVGTSRLVNGEVATDLAYYLATSEQIGSSVGIGVLVGKNGGVRAAGGFLLQALPSPDLDPASETERERIIDLMIKRSEGIESVSHHIADGASSEEFAQTLVGDLPLRFMGRDALEFRCTCSREKAAGILATMKPAELRELFADSDTAEVTCEFCRQAFTFTRDEIPRLDPGDENRRGEEKRR